MTETQDFLRCVGPDCKSVVSEPTNTLCPAHYRQQYAGRELSPIGSNWHKNEEDCSVDECTRVVHCGGRCYGHYQHMRNWGFTKPLPPREEVPCAQEGCSRRVKAKGLCSSHYNKYRIEHTPECSFEVCERKSESQGLCSSHNAQRRAGKELTDIRPWGTYNKGVPCPVKDCELPASGPTGCGKHRGIGKDYNLSVDRISELRKDCAVCGSTKNLAVDHDHACCDRFGSCGKCVRDILCSNCNTALGHVKDSKDRLRGLIAYLERFEV